MADTSENTPPCCSTECNETPESSSSPPAPPSTPVVDTPDEDESKSASESAPASKEEKPPQINLLEVDVTNEQVALNVLIGFLGVAQRRGCFAMNESAKIFECVNKFKSE